METLLSLTDGIVMCCVGVSGFVSANMYTKMSGKQWVSNVNLTSALFTRECLHSLYCSLLCHCLML